ncbi:TetR/AcrR family transcriptional regulator [Pseudonocardia sp. GCM10023141]|uniref:TetR/AcrR family transcriptional regulator n=1 Tax=Pseudonocardia sp. GCM10023141 TaxID=3252653 RepID=UPI0036175669
MPEPTRRRGARRDEIADQAGILFSERGFHSVRMEEIAEAVGITVRALYRHYPGKQALLAFVVIRDQDRLVNALQNLEQKPADDLDTAQIILHELAMVSLVSRHLSLLWQREARHLQPDDFQFVRRRTIWIAEQIKQLVVIRMQPGLDAFSADLRSWALVSLLTSSVYYDAALPPAALTQEIVAACVRIIAAKAECHGSEVAGLSPPPALVQPVSRREQLLVVAARVFRRRGFGGVTLDEIGDDLDIVGAALYRYFPTKASILAAAVTRFHEWICHEMFRTLAHPQEDPCQTLMSLSRGYLRVEHEATDYLAVALNERLFLPNDVRAQTDRMRLDNTAEWIRWYSLAESSASPAQSAVRVHITQRVIDDCVRIPRLAAHPDFVPGMHSVIERSLGLTADD